MVLLPGAPAVTRPAVDTVATDVDELVHVTVVAKGVPLWSRTWAVSCTVAPSASSVDVEGLTLTVVGTGVGGAGGVPLPLSPHALRINNKPVVIAALRAISVLFVQ
jgi:hypothetical protein